jgi:hypothetical protein
LQNNIRKPKVYTDDTVKYGLSTALPESSSLSDALASDHWREALQTEYDALMRNNTWHLVSPQHGQNIIDCKWVYKVKVRPDGSIDRYKARLCAKIQATLWFGL